ncbi:MAG: ATP-binding protein [Tissierellia bacterium]|nr:ATP-binding protein [Tissierellia bacterium]
MDVRKMDFTYTASVCSDLNLIRDFVDELLTKLDGIIEDSDTMFDIRLIINELVINGVFHGNECQDTKCIKLNLEINDKEIIIQVEDEGDGIDYDFSKYDPYDLKCSGRGLILVKGLSDELIVNQNRITAIKYLEKQRLRSK